MSSKKNKSMKASEKSSKNTPKKKIKIDLITPDAWINELAATNIDEEDWKCSVAVIEEETNDASIFLERFNEYARKSERLAVKAITKLDVIQYVVKNMVENNPGKDITPLSLLCTEIFNICGATFETEIPTSLLGCVMKYIILSYKADNKVIRTGLIEKKNEFENYQESLWNVPKSGKLESSKATVSSKTKTQSDKSVKVPKSTSKPFTKLRKRGEEWKDVTWVDDAPINGPQLYIAVSTFYNADLPLEMINLNIPLHAIIKVKSQSFADSEQSDALSHLKLSSKTQESILYPAEQQKCLKILKFWNKIDVLKNEPPTSKLFSNIMFLEFLPGLCKLPFESSPFAKEIHDQMSYFLYDTFDITELHKKYISEIKCTDVLEKNIVLDSAGLEMYNLLLDNTPPEVLTVPFILDCLIEQTCELESPEKRISNDKQLSSESILTENQSFMKLLEDLNYKYDLCDNINGEDANSALDHNPTISKCNIKKVLKHFDKIGVKTFHLENNIQQFTRNRTKQILLIAWNDHIGQLTPSAPLSEQAIKQCNKIIRNSVLSEDDLYLYVYFVIIYHMMLPYFPSSILEGTCPGSKSQLTHYSNGDLCEDCLLEVKGVFKTSHCQSSTCTESRCSSHQSVQYNGEDLCDECLLLVQTLKSRRSTLQSCKVGIFCKNVVQNELFTSDKFFIEYLSAEVMVQKIQEVAHNFSQTEARWCPHSNQIIIVFHNLLREGTWLYENKWRGVLRTQVPIRDFVEYIMEEESTWLNSLETFPRKSREPQGQAMCLSDHNFDTKPNYDFLTPDTQFISFRSLKYETIQKLLQIEKSTTAKSKQKIEKVTASKTKDSSNKSDKSSKKDKKTIKADLKASKKEHGHDFPQQENDKENFAFIGYDLEGPIRFQFDGYLKDLPLTDNCKIRLNMVKKLYETPVHSTVLTICDHSLYYTHKVFNNSNVSPFHFISSSGIIFSFRPHIPLKKDSNDVNSEPFTGTPLQFHNQENHQLSLDGKDKVSNSSQLKEGKRKSSRFYPPPVVEKHLFEISSSYDLQLSLPSGLHCEIVHTGELFYIRQHFLSKGPLAKTIINEKLRCFTTDGQIVKYMTDGTIHILSPNGALCSIYEMDDSIEISDTNQTPTEKKEGTEKDRIWSPLDETKTKRKTSRETNNITNSQKQPDLTPEDFYTSTNNRSNYPTINFTKYSQTTSDGRRFVKTNSRTEALPELLIISTNNIANDCINCERLDGVKTKFKSDGSLITHFPDGSRITSIPFETEQIFCEWDSDDFNKWFGNSSLSDSINLSCSDSKVTNFPSRDTMNSSGKGSQNSKRLSETTKKSSNGVVSKTNKKLSKNSKVSSLTDVEESNKSIGLFEKDNSIENHEEQSYNNFHKLNFLEDGFVVISVKYLMEHPNYISLEVNDSRCEIDFILPFDTKISLRENGIFRITMDGVMLMVDKDEVKFSRINNTGKVTRSIILNTSSQEAKEYTFNTEQDKTNFTQNTERPAAKSSKEQTDMERKMQNSNLICVSNGIGSEIIVDKQLNIRKYDVSKEQSNLDSENMSCFALNPDLSGFRFVQEKEVDVYSANVVDNNGLVLNNGSRLFTSLPLVQNESEKWLMNYKQNYSDDDFKLNYPSTYGQKEDWLQPFVEKESVVKAVNSYEAVTVRLLYEMFTDKIFSNDFDVPNNRDFLTSEETPILMKVSDKKCEVNIDEMIVNPFLLCQLIDKEMEERNKANDKFRTNVERKFMRSLVNQAIISARKARRKTVEHSLKKALKEKTAPPYHLSCFGQVHGILDEVLGHVGEIRKTASSTFTFDMVNVILDELLSLTFRKETEKGSDKTIGRESFGVKSILSDIFRNFCEVSQVKSDQNIINSVLDKPISLVSSSDVELLCSAVNFNSCNCPFLDKERFIFEDVLQARHQLSHYFDTLRKMFEFYRSKQEEGYSQSQISL